MIRKQLDPFANWAETRAGTRPNEASWSMARKLSTRVGPSARVIDRYLNALACAPAHHLEILRRRGARILFGPTIPDALASPWAAERRGRALAAAELWNLRMKYSPESETAGIYDPELDVLVLPTSYVAGDCERVVFHELGHALTMARASIRSSLVEGLPPAIACHVRSPHYGAGSDAETLRAQVLEALAESYAYLLVGQEGLLPAAIVSELIFILTTVADEDQHIRFDLDAETDRTATRVKRSEMIFPEDPGGSDLLVPRPQAGEELEASDLETDDLAVRRWRRRAA